MLVVIHAILIHGHHQTSATPIFRAIASHFTLKMEEKRSSETLVSYHNSNWIFTGVKNSDLVTFG